MRRILIAIVVLVAAVGAPVAYLLFPRGEVPPPIAAATPAILHPADAHVDPPADAAPATKASKTDVCTAACKASQEKCGVSYAESCVDACQRYSGDAIDCLAAAGDDCNRLANCALGALCKLGPTGSTGCRKTGTCVVACGQDSECSCRCIRQLDAGEAHVFAKFASCALVKCAADCGAGAQRCLTCVKAHCTSSATACMAQ
jgi:hypothetical protein